MRRRSLTIASALCALLAASSVSAASSRSPDCTGWPDGVYSVDCSRDFWYCTGGVSRTARCPVGTVLDPSKNVCDFEPHVASCKKTDGATNSTEEQPGTRAPLDEEPGNSYGVVTDAPPAHAKNYPTYPPRRSRVTPAPSFKIQAPYNADNVIEATAPLLPSCREGARYSLGACRPSFVECIYGELKTRFCPRGTTFDPSIDECVHEQQECQKPLAAVAADTRNISQPSNTECAPGFVASVDGSDCADSFVECSPEGRLHWRQCVPGRRFDPTTRSCQPAIFVAGCGTTEQDVPTQSECVAGDVVSSAPCSAEYLRCEGGRYAFVHCPKGALFDESVKSCLASATLPQCTVDTTTSTTSTTPSPSPSHAAPSQRVLVASSPVQNSDVPTVYLGVAELSEPLATEYVRDDFAHQPDEFFHGPRQNLHPFDTKQHRQRVDDEFKGHSHHPVSNSFESRRRVGKRVRTYEDEFEGDYEDRRHRHTLDSFDNNRRRGVRLDADAFRVRARKLSKNVEELFPDVPSDKKVLGSRTGSATKRTNVGAEGYRVRRKRSYVQPQVRKTVCGNYQALTTLSLGFCLPDFVFCRSSETHSIAACPLGDLYDSVYGRCVRFSSCGFRHGEARQPVNPEAVGYPTGPAQAAPLVAVPPPPYNTGESRQVPYNAAPARDVDTAAYPENDAPVVVTNVATQAPYEQYRPAADTNSNRAYEPTYYPSSTGPRQFDEVITLGTTAVPVVPVVINRKPYYETGPKEEAYSGTAPKHTDTYVRRQNIPVVSENVVEGPYEQYRPYTGYTPEHTDTYVRRQNISVVSENVVEGPYEQYRPVTDTTSKHVYQPAAATTATPVVPVVAVRQPPYGSVPETVPRDMVPPSEQYGTLVHRQEIPVVVDETPYQPPRQSVFEHPAPSVRLATSTTGAPLPAAPVIVERKPYETRPEVAPVIVEQKPYYETGPKEVAYSTTAPKDTDTYVRPQDIPVVNENVVAGPYDQYRPVTDSTSKHVYQPVAATTATPVVPVVPVVAVRQPSSNPAPETVPRNVVPPSEQYGTPVHRQETPIVVNETPVVVDETPYQPPRQSVFERPAPSVRLATSTTGAPLPVVPVNAERKPSYETRPELAPVIVEQKPSYETRPEVAPVIVEQKPFYETRPEVAPVDAGRTPSYETRPEVAPYKPTSAEVPATVQQHVIDVVVAPSISSSPQPPNAVDTTPAAVNESYEQDRRPDVAVSSSNLTYKSTRHSAPSGWQHFDDEVTTSTGAPRELPVVLFSAHLQNVPKRPSESLANNGSESSAIEHGRNTYGGDNYYPYLSENNAAAPGEHHTLESRRVMAPPRPDARCIGAAEGESRVIGHCRTSYIVCSKNNSATIASCDADEVFSLEAGHKCIARQSAPECVRRPTVVLSPTPRQPAGRGQFCAVRDDGIYRHPTRCAQVVQCFDGDAFEYPLCPSNLAFNEATQRCDYRDNVAGCTVAEDAVQLNSTVINSKKGCDGAQHGAHVADSDDCHVFWRCVWDHLERMECPTGTAFNPLLSVCDYPDRVPGCKNTAAVATAADADADVNNTRRRI